MTKRLATDEHVGAWIDIAIEAAGWPDEPELRPLVETAVAVAIEELGLDGIQTELSVVFTDEATMTTLNGRWRGKQRPTNVLSFPAFPVAPGERPGPLMGDIVLARQTITSEAAIDGKSVDAHLTHLIVHGFLHLLGYDHQKDEDAELMERIERAILDRLGIDDPYAPIFDDMKDDGRPTI